MDNIIDACPTPGAVADNILWMGTRTIQNALERGSTGGAIIELAFARLRDTGRLHPYAWQRQRVIDAIAKGLLNFINPEDTVPVLDLALGYGIGRHEISASLMRLESQKSTEIYIAPPSADYMDGFYHVITQSVAHGTRAYITEIQSLETEGFLSYPECRTEVVAAVVKGLRNASAPRRMAVYGEVRLFDRGLASDLKVAIQEMPVAAEPQKSPQDTKTTAKKASPTASSRNSPRVSAAAAKAQVTKQASAAPKPPSPKASLGPPPPPHIDAK